MNYKKKYEAMVQRAREFHEAGNALTKKQMEIVCPELAESEDEKIRKGLIDIFNTALGQDFLQRKAGLNEKEVIAYLEKQKEQKPAEWKPTEEQFNYLAKAIMTLGEEGDCKTAGVLSEIRKGLKCSFPDWKVSPDYPEEGCNVSLNGEVKKIQEWSEDFDKEVESVHKRYPEVSFAKLTRIAYHFAKWADKYKSTEWSEEDERIIDTIVSVLGQYIDYKAVSGTGSGYATPRHSKEIDWLKSLRPQSQGTYKQIIHNIYNMLKDKDFFEIRPPHLVSLLNDIRVKCKDADECATILDEPSWKPSEEQMSMLLAVIRDPNNAGSESCHLALESLYEQLKKL